MHFTILLVSLLFISPVKADEPEKTLDMHSLLIPPGITISSQEKYGLYYEFHLAGQWKANGESKGTLSLDPNAPAYDELGYSQRKYDVPNTKLDCTFTFVKKIKMKVHVGRRIGSEETKEIEWTLLEIKGPKINSKLFLAILGDETYPSGRLLLHDEKGNVKQAIDMHTEGPQEPCHPGCFPVGTKIALDSGTKLIETIRVGDSIKTMSKDGKPGEAKVTFIYVTKNRLIEVKTESGSLITTETQPLSLASGELKAAGELKKGDIILRIIAGKRFQVTVKGIETTSRHETVFNLVLGEPTLFIANGFLVRSKPPAVVEATK